MKRVIIPVIIGILFFLGLGKTIEHLQTSRPLGSTKGYLMSQSIPLLPSPSFIQEQINLVLLDMNEPMLKVDGRIGPKTCEAWDKAYCWQQGIYHCELAGMKTSAK